MIESDRVLVVGGDPKKLVYKSNGASTVVINASGGGVILGGPSLTILNGFRPDSGNFALSFANNEELWAESSSTTIVSLLIKT